MRGFLQPSVHAATTDSQNAFRALGRARRMKVARAAQTTLLKADQWGRGSAVTADLADALERAFKATTTKGKK